MPDWSHSPVHRLGVGGAYFVTAGTYLKQHHFRTRRRLDFLRDEFLKNCEANQVELRAWALFSNHYHLVAYVEDPKTLFKAIKTIHQKTGFEINRIESAQGRKVWFQYRDTLLTNEGSYLARLRYVHYNPVHHRLVRNPTSYPWCSAAWFEREAPANLQKTLETIRIDHIRVSDDFKPILENGEEAPGG